ncbi:MAG TPA: RICIN domain-containing protein [Dehalococcoidia bacterium]|nr:RICIN domain-containing protein [Dehalococcoidia bacterium]
MTKYALALLSLAFLLLAGSPAPAEAHNVQTTLRAFNSDKCLTIGGGDQRNGAVAIQWTCGPGSNIELVDAGNGRHYIKLIHSGKCLTVNGNAWWDGATLDQWDCLGQPNQKWSGFFGGGAYEVHSSEAFPDKCLTVHEGSSADGAVVNQWQCIARQGNLAAATNQAWQRRDWCHSSYVGGTARDTGDCIRATVVDYDCWPGDGDGPRYVIGPVTVVGPDDFRLDPDNDGVGCK